MMHAIGRKAVAAFLRAHNSLALSQILSWKARQGYFTRNAKPAHSSFRCLDSAWS